MINLGITLAAAFLLIPLPLCIFLIFKRRRDLARIEILEEKVESLSTQPIAAPIAPSAEEKSPAPTTPIVFTDEPEKAEPETVPPAPVPPPIPYPTRIAKKTSPRETPPQPATAARSEPVFIPFLQSIGLWPPAGSLRAEAGLMQWWLPRIGGLLATLALISAAVYVGQNTLPWIRFVELLLADAAVFAAAVYFLRKNPKFGKVLLSTGLTLAYLTSIAAYAAPPVRVIDSPLLGILVQFSVIAGVFAVSLFRSDRHIGIIALIYGYTSSLFCSYLGLNEPALIAALSLYIAGIAINRSFNSKAILSISAIGVYAPVLAIVVLHAIRSTTLTLPSEQTLIGFLFISVSILPLRELIKPHFDSDVPIFRKLHTANTTLFLGLGYLYLKTFTTHLTLFYGISALLFLAFAAFFSRRSLSSFLFQLFFLKGLALSALWFVNNFQGDIRWFALAVQAPLVAWVAGRSKSVYQEIACFILWIISSYLALGAYAYDQPPFFSIAGAIFLAQPILAALFLSALFDTLKQNKKRIALYGLAALANGYIAYLFLSGGVSKSHQLPGYIGLYSLIFAAIAFSPRLALFPASVSGAFLVFAANLSLLSEPSSLISLSIVVALAATAAYASASYANARKHKSFSFLEYAFHIAWFASIYAFLSDHYQNELWFALFPAIASVIFLIVPSAGSKTIRDLSIVPLLLYLFYGETPDMGQAFRALAILAFLSPLFATRFASHKERDFGLLDKGESWRVILHLAVYIILLRFLFQIDTWLPLNLFALGIALAYCGLWYIHKRAIALVLSLLTTAGLFTCLLVSRNSFLIGQIDTQPWPTEVLFSGIALATTTLALAIILNLVPHPRIGERGKAIYAYAGGIVAYLAIALTLSHQELSLSSHLTPLLALFCLLLVGLGFGLKNKPFRFVALAGFLFPLGRLFAHDIRDTLTRIIAFGILAALLLFIGYLYHRFQSRID